MLAHWANINVSAVIFFALSFNSVNAGGESPDCDVIKSKTISLLQSEAAPLLKPHELHHGKDYVRPELSQQLEIKSKQLLECSTLSKKYWVRDGKEISADFMGAYIHVSVLILQLEVLRESQDQGILKEFLEDGFVENVESTYSKAMHALTSPPAM